MNTQLQSAKDARHSQNFAGAEQILTDLFRHYPDAIEVHEEYARLRYAQHRFAASIPYLERLLERGVPEPAQREMMWMLGNAHRCIGSYEKAETIFEQAIEKYYAPWEFMIFLTMTLHNNGKHTEATQYLLELLLSSTKSKTVKAYRGVIEFYSEHLDVVWKE